MPYTLAHASRWGYTLIEIVVVIAIIGLLTGASIAGFNTLNKRQTVLNGGRELMSAMRTAQERATSGIKPSSCTQLVGYSITASAGSNTYSLSAVCSNATTAVKSYLLPNGVTFLNAVSTRFNVQTGGVVGAGTITVKSASYTYTMNVSSGGDITENKLQ